MGTDPLAYLYPISMFAAILSTAILAGLVAFSAAAARASKLQDFVPSPVCYIANRLVTYDDVLCRAVHPSSGATKKSYLTPVPEWRIQSGSGS